MIRDYMDNVVKYCVEIILTIGIGIMSALVVVFISLLYVVPVCIVIYFGFWCAKYFGLI